MNKPTQEAAERIADAAIADLRKQGLDCVSSGSYDDASRHIRMAIIRACADTFKEAAEVIEQLRLDVEDAAQRGN